MKVEVRKLRKSFPTPAEPVVVLDDLDLEIESGEALAITGPSGCGKSTLLHILGTLDEPDSGELRLGDVEPFGLGAEELAAFRNAKIGFVFQDHYLLPQCTVLENVLVPTFVGAAFEGSPRGRAKELLAAVGLADRETHRPAELSGGERQRAAIARALIRSPGLLLCDEPTGNLDTSTAEAIGDLFVELQSSTGATLVVVTHSEELAGRFSNRLRLRERRLSGSAS